mgnify:FL=1
MVENVLAEVVLQFHERSVLFVRRNVDLGWDVFYRELVLDVLTMLMGGNQRAVLIRRLHLSF